MIREAIESARVVVVGAGLFGLTVAERVASTLGLPVALVERRDCLGGNVASYIEPETGIEVHRYGSHIFHTNSERVMAYLSKFMELNRYQHRVVARSQDRYLSMPINLGTLSAFFGQALTPTEAQLLLESERQKFSARGDSPSDLESWAISQVGERLYEALIRHYTAKQWQTDPRTLDASIIARLPVRFTMDDRYFGDRFQGIPVDGYSAWVSAMSRSPLIRVLLGTSFGEIRHLVREDQLVVYTGPLDEFFDFAAGRLPWRTLDFETEVVRTGHFQGCAVVNYVDAEPSYTRIHEFRYYHPERTYPEDKSVVMREYSRFAQRSDEPYYPVLSTGSRGQLNEYRSMANMESNVLFGGRLGSFKYLDMHMAVASALQMFENEIVPWLERSQHEQPSG